MCEYSNNINIYNLRVNAKSVGGEKEEFWYLECSGFHLQSE